MPQVNASEEHDGDGQGGEHAEMETLLLPVGAEWHVDWMFVGLVWFGLVDSFRTLR